MTYTIKIFDGTQWVESSNPVPVDGLLHSPTDPPGGVKGDVYVNTTDHQLYYRNYNNDAWADLGVDYANTTATTYANATNINSHTTQIAALTTRIAALEAIKPIEFTYTHVFPVVSAPETSIPFGALIPDDGSGRVVDANWQVQATIVSSDELSIYISQCSVTMYLGSPITSTTFHRPGTGGTAGNRDVIVRYMVTPP